MTEVVVGTKASCPLIMAPMTIPSHLIRQGAFTVKQKRNFVGEAISAERTGTRAVQSRTFWLSSKLAGCWGGVAFGSRSDWRRSHGHQSEWPLSERPMGFHGDTLAVTLFMHWCAISMSRW